MDSHAGLMGRKERKKYQRSTKTKHKHPARMNLMLPLGESMVVRRIKVAYIRLLEESGEAAMIPKEVVDEPPPPEEEDPFARVWSKEDDAAFLANSFRLRETFEGGNCVESRRSTTPMRDFPWSKICVFLKKLKLKIKIKLHNQIHDPSEPPRRKEKSTTYRIYTF